VSSNHVTKTHVTNDINEKHYQLQFPPKKKNSQTDTRLGQHSSLGTDRHQGTYIITEKYWKYWQLYYSNNTEKYWQLLTTILLKNTIDNYYWQLNYWQLLTTDRQNITNITVFNTFNNRKHQTRTMWFYNQQCTHTCETCTLYIIVYIWTTSSISDTLKDYRP